MRKRMDANRVSHHGRGAGAGAGTGSGVGTRAGAGASVHEADLDVPGRLQLAVQPVPAKVDRAVLTAQQTLDRRAGRAA